MDAKIIAEEIFLAGVESVMPAQMTGRNIFKSKGRIFLGNKELDVGKFEHVYVIGAGKASAKMALEIESVLGDKISSGHVVVKYGHGCKLQYIDVSEAGHPVPDANGYAATKKILELAKQATENDLVICLISGGGSSLLTDLPADSSMEELITLNELLLRSGADIQEINAVRKHLSKVKGGQLAQSAFPATVVTLILSDVIGDPLHSIASGPTVPDPTTFADAIAVLNKYDLHSKVSPILTAYLRMGINGLIPETPKPGDPVFTRSHNFIIGSNKIALEACKKKASDYGLNSFIITSQLDGDLAGAAKEIVDKAIVYQNNSSVKKPCCLLFGGETTVKVTGSGVGGRNQHFALYASILLKDQTGITLLSAGTDGNDGPTPAAGAVVDTNTYPDAIYKGLKVEEYLQNFDSYHFFEKAGGHIITGPTMTNVMDLIVVIIE
ncbi:MAG TPA: glycerate kinase [Hanamia sp.]|nr:glycerate kinase [Hanamia sp.]